MQFVLLTISDGHFKGKPIAVNFDGVAAVGPRYNQLGSWISFLDGKDSADTIVEEDFDYIINKLLK